MKKIILIIALIGSFLTPVSLWAVGTCVESIGYIRYDTTNSLSTKTVTFVCTADAGAATFPSTAFSATAMEQITGWFLLTGSTLNGATGPTAGTLITLSTSTEGDILGGAGKTPPAATAALANKFKPFVDSANLSPGAVPISSGLTLAITGNAVNSAVTTIVFKFIK